MSNYDDMKALIESLSGQPAIISILRLYVDIFGDLDTAAVVSQVTFWSDKGTVEEGWFFKSRAEWHKTIGIKRSALDSAIKRANSIAPGIIQTKTMPAKHNSPTLFYRLDMDTLSRTVINHLQSRLAEIDKSNARSAEISKSDSQSRSVEINTSDVLKSTNPSVEINTSSYSSLQQKKTTEENAEAAGAKPPKKGKPAKEQDSLLKHPAVVTYRDVMHLTPNDVQRREIADKVGNNGHIEDWRIVLEDWKLHGWKPGNIPGQLEKFAEKIGAHHESVTGSTHSRTTPSPEPTYTPEQLAAADAINARRAAKQAMHGG